MDDKTFKEVLEEQIAQCKQVLQVKNLEYSTDLDRLSNFKIAARLQGETVPQALAGMWSKHIISIFDMIKTGQSYSHSHWTEKITDAINYLLLLQAVLHEDLVMVDRSESKGDNC